MAASSSRAPTVQVPRAGGAAQFQPLDDEHELVARLFVAERLASTGSVMLLLAVSLRHLDRQLPVGQLGCNIVSDADLIDRSDRRAILSQQDGVATIQRCLRDIARIRQMVLDQGGLAIDG